MVTISESGRVADFRVRPAGLAFGRISVMLLDNKKL
jgi:hypothetical protein